MTGTVTLLNKPYARRKKPARTSCLIFDNEKKEATVLRSATGS